MCEAGQPKRDNPKLSLVYELTESRFKDLSIVICLNNSSRFRASHSYLIAAPFKALFIEFNKKFFEGANKFDLRAIAAHELSHYEEQTHCADEVTPTTVADYTACELSVDIRASQMPKVSNCEMLHALKYVHSHWKKVAPTEVTSLKERIAWFEKNSQCTSPSR